MTAGVLTMLSIENFLHITRSVKSHLNPVFQFSCSVFMFLKTRFNLTCLFGVNGALDVCLLFPFWSKTTKAVMY